MRKPFVCLVLLASTVSSVALAQTSPVRQAEQTPTGAEAGHASVAPASRDKPQFGTFGFDMAGRDTAVQPGVDFFDHANGTWYKNAQIPADRSSYGMFHVLQDLSLTRTRGILEEASKRPGDKIGDYYASFMDQAAADAKGVSPVQPWLVAVKAAPTKDALLLEMAKLQRLGVGGFFGMGIGPDDKDPNTYAVTFSQGGLGLPDRDYYLRDDAKLAAARTAYQVYIARMLGFAGEPGADARAAAVVNLEKAIATVHWMSIESYDSDKTYNRWTAADFTAKAPGIAWGPYMTALGVAGLPYYIVSQPSAVAGEAKVVADAPLPVLRDYAALRIMGAFAPYLSKEIEGANFTFYGTALSGAPQQQDRWKRGVGTVSGGLGTGSGGLSDAVGRQYVAKYFPPASKAAIDALVKNVIVAMGARLDKLEWMAPETKVKARQKLAALTPKIGYPDTWRDYSALQIKRNDLVGNVARANAFNHQRDLDKLGKPIDRGEWSVTPMSLNAYASSGMNQIVFPAAILQPPFFDPKADPAVNYGAIGAVIGHEITHHFDNRGRKYDASGKLTDWWTEQDVTRFKALTDALVAQYDAYEPLPGQHIRGGLTLGDDIADLAGLTVALDAYHRSLGGKRAPVIDGMTGDQRFYYGWAQVWRIKYREQALQQVLLSDHSPGRYRVWTVRNLDPWYAAFGPKPGQPMYLPPAQRVRIW